MFLNKSGLLAKMVYYIYRNRAYTENRIKGLKYNTGAVSFNSQDFWAIEATLNFVMIAINEFILSGYLGAEVQHFLKNNIRYQVFAIDGYMVRKGNYRILKLSLAMKRREWFSGFWSSTKPMDWHFFVPS